jgi:5,10-methylenetetrahydromethanopterin reductase
MQVSTKSPRIGLRWDPGWDPIDLSRVATFAEQVGFDELWMVEDCFSAGGLTSASLALAATERLEVGIGLLPAVVRNPAIAAMELAVLARVYPKRFLAAFGHGVPEWMRQIGSEPAHRMASLRETVDAVRTLLHGEKLDFSGRHVHLDNVRLEHPPQFPPPILIGTTGPRGLALAGRSADGILLVELATPAAVEWSRLQSGANPGRVVAYCLLSIDDDDAAGLVAVRPQVERWMRSGAYPYMSELAGMGRDGAGPLADDVLATIAAAGRPETCRRTIEALWDAGADSVVLLPRSTAGIEQVRRFAEEVLPALRDAAGV